MNNEFEFVPVSLSPLPDDAPDWAQTLNTNLGAVASSVNQIGAAMTNVDNTFTAIRDQVGPVVDSLSGNPMFRMLVGGSKS